MASRYQSALCFGVRDDKVYDKRGLEPVGETDKATLLRRVYLDLIGLPPTPEEIDAFLHEREGEDSWTQRLGVVAALVALLEGVAPKALTAANFVQAIEDRLPVLAQGREVLGGGEAGLGLLRLDGLEAAPQLIERGRPADADAVGPAVDRAATGDDAVGGQPGADREPGRRTRERVRELAVLDEAAVVDEQRDPLHHGDRKMIIALRTDLVVAIDFLAIDDFTAVVALEPHALGAF